MEPIATVSASELDADPSARLWALVFYLAERPEAQQLPAFRDFWLSYIYDAEVNNGGHLQYFHNQGTLAVPATIQALESIGAASHAHLLTECWHQVQDHTVSRVKSVNDYPALAAERSFTAEDRAYYDQASLLELLEVRYAQLINQAIAVDA